MRVAQSTLFSVLLILSSFSGCFGLFYSDEVESEEEIDELVFGNYGGAYSVVAPIDTGINVYHERFILNETLPDWLLAGLGVTMWCNITIEGTWQERYDADKETCWDVITSTDIAVSYTHLTLPTILRV